MDCVVTVRPAESVPVAHTVVLDNDVEVVVAANTDEMSANKKYNHFIVEVL